MSVVVEKDDGGKGRFESEVKECKSILFKHQWEGIRGWNIRGGGE